MTLDNVRMLTEHNLWKDPDAKELQMYELWETTNSLASASYQYSHEMMETFTVGEIAFVACRMPDAFAHSGYSFNDGGSKYDFIGESVEKIAALRAITEPNTALAWLVFYILNKGAWNSRFEIPDPFDWYAAAHKVGLGFDEMIAYISLNYGASNLRPEVIKNDIDPVMYEALVSQATPLWT